MDLTSFKTGIDSFSYQPMETMGGDFPDSKSSLGTSAKNVVAAEVWKLQGFSQSSEHQMLVSVGATNEPLPSFSPQESQELEANTMQLLQNELKKNPEAENVMKTALGVIQDTIELRGMVNLTRSALQQV
ncbi:hypothetical protein ACWJJH_11010 [Endozoicomonadaceae bacterium StTr2]